MSKVVLWVTEKGDSKLEEMERNESYTKPENDFLTSLEDAYFDVVIDEYNVTTEQDVYKHCREIYSELYSAEMPLTYEEFSDLIREGFIGLKEVQE